MSEHKSGQDYKKAREQIQHTHYIQKCVQYTPQIGEKKNQNQGTNRDKIVSTCGNHLFVNGHRTTLENWLLRQLLLLTQWEHFSNNKDDY